MKTTRKMAVLSLMCGNYAMIYGMEETYLLNINHSRYFDKIERTEGVLRKIKGAFININGAIDILLSENQERLSFKSGILITKPSIEFESYDQAPINIAYKLNKIYRTTNSLKEKFLKKEDLQESIELANNITCQTIEHLHSRTQSIYNKPISTYSYFQYIRGYLLNVLDNLKDVK